METDGPDSYGYQAWLVATINAELGSRRWNYAELARLCSMNKSSLGRYLRMERHMTVDQMAAIANALGFDTAGLAERTAQRRHEASPAERAAVIISADPTLSWKQKLARMSGASHSDADIESPSRRLGERPAG